LFLIEFFQFFHLLIQSNAFSEIDNCSYLKWIDQLIS